MNMAVLLVCGVREDGHREVLAIERAFPGASWQHCKVHFMRNILIHVSKRHKKTFAGLLKLIWQEPNKEVARKQAKALAERYGDRYPKAIEVLEDGLEDSLIFFDFPSLDSR